MAAAVATAAASFGIATGAYVDERDDWHSAVARARREGWRWLELTAIRGRLEPLLAYLADHPDALDGFERISLHARPLLDRARHVPWLLEAELAGGAT